MTQDIGSYEQHCIDYALYGNPERDHWEHEEAARYDQHDGLRADFEAEFGWEAHEPLASPEEFWTTELWLETQAEEQLIASWASFGDPVPF